MFLFLASFVLSTSGEYCNETTVLPPNMNCCKNTICDGYCYHRFGKNKKGEVTVDYYYCANEQQKFMCVDIYKGFPIVELIVLLPLLISLLVALILRVKIPVASIISDLIVAASLGCLIYGISCVKNFWFDMMGFIISGAIIWLMISIFRCSNITYGCDCGRGRDITSKDFIKRNSVFNKSVSQDCSNCCGQCCGQCCCECCNCQGCCAVCTEKSNQQCGCIVESLEVLKELRSPVVGKEELSTIIEENHLIPPSPQIEVIDFNRGSKGQAIIIKERQYDMNYGSWQEESAIPVIDDSRIVAYNCHSEYTYDDDMKDMIVKTKEEAKEAFPKEAAFQAFVDISVTSGFINRAVGVENESKLVNFCSSGLVTGFLYQIGIGLGLSSLFDLIWLANVKRVEETSFKRIALDENKFRAKKGERDRNIIINKYSQNAERTNLL